MLHARARWEDDGPHAYIRDIPDFPKPGILFKDITPLLADPAAFQHAVDLLAEHYRGQHDRRHRRGRGPRLPVRRPAGPGTEQAAHPAAQAGQAAVPDALAPVRPGVRQAELHVHIDGVKPRARVLLVDDLLATGGTMEAGCQLIEQAGGKVVGCAFLVELEFLKRPREARSRTRCSA